MKIDQLLSKGIDGTVYSLADHPDRVVKFCFMTPRWIDQQQALLELQETLDYLLHYPEPSYVKVFDYCSNKPYYVMEKLNKISEDESKVFHSIISHEDRGIIKNYSLEKIQKMLDGMRQGLDFDPARIKLFCQQVKNCPVQNRDLHPRNIMKNNFGDFKIIDLDRCFLKRKAV